jgi:hypothetical protein
MKIAILISGQPRFNQEFNDLLNKLDSNDHIDFFFYLWNSSPSENVFIPPTWPTDSGAIESKIRENLPANVNIADIKILPQIEYTVTKSYNLTPWSNPVNIWYTYHGIKMVNEMRERYEQVNGVYDLVIKGRPDTGIDRDIDFNFIKQYLDENPSTVIVPNDRRYGMAGVPVNDLLGIGLPATMSTYCRAVDYFDQYNDQGCPYHGETLLAWHLTKNKINIPETNFNCTFREHWYAHNKPDYGSWL